MRHWPILAAVAVFAVALPVGAALPAVGAPRGGLETPRITSVRGVCEGGGHLAVSLSQSPSGDRLDISAFGLPAGQVWNEYDSTYEAGLTGGAGGSYTGWTTDDVTFSTFTTFGHMTNPVARVKIASQDGAVTCKGRVWPQQQWGMTTCKLNGRLLTATVTRKGDRLRIESRFRTAKPNTTWNFEVALVTPHQSAGAAMTARAGRAGIAHATTSVPYAANRTLTLSFTGKQAHGCKLTLGTHRVPQ
jgi:hypothetical protein